MAECGVSDSRILWTKTERMESEAQDEPWPLRARPDSKPAEQESHRKRTALFIYNGSVRGKLSGGEYVYGKIRTILKDNFTVRELVLDDLVPDAPFKGRQVMKRVILVALVFASYVFYGNYDLIVTTWTPEVPFYGDFSYIQSYAGLFEPDRSSSRTGILEAFGRHLLALPLRLLAAVSLRKQTFVAASVFCKDNIASRFKKDSRIVYPPAPLNEELETKQRDNIVLSMGRISPEKRFEALAQVGPRVPEARFILAGQAAEMNLKVVNGIEEAFADVGLGDHFEFAGWISVANKDRLQGSAKVFFHPAERDPFPLVIIEAMNHGVIPVVHNSGGARELAPDVLTFNDYDEASRKIKQALKEWSPLVATRLHERSMQFNSARFRSEILGSLDDILSKKAHRPHSS